jgi:hypothetical protein
MKIGELTLSKKIIFFSPILLNTFFLIYLAIKIGTGFLLIHDSPLFVTSIDAFKTFGYFWLDNNFGSINFLSFSLSFFPQAISYALFTIGLPIQLIQIIFYFFILNGIFYTSFISFYKSLELIRMRSEPSFFIPSLIGAFFYTYNLYMIASWHGGTVDGLFLLYMSAPLVMYLFLQILIKEFTLFHTLLLALCIALCINTFPFALALYLILFTILLLVKKQFFLIKNIRLLILLVIVSIGMSFFFLVPIFLTFLIGDPFPLLDGGQAYVFSNYGLQGMFRFYFDWTINQNWGGRYFHSYFPYYNNILIALSAFLLWFMIFKTYWNKFNSRAKEASTFLISGVVLSLFFAKGIQAPFGEINLFFYRYVPLFNIFRTPDTKFGLPVAPLKINI